MSRGVLIRYVGEGWVLAQLTFSQIGLRRPDRVETDSSRRRIKRACVLWPRKEPMRGNEREEEGTRARWVWQEGSWETAGGAQDGTGLPLPAERRAQSTAPGSEPRYRAQVPRQALGPGEKRPRLSSCISRLSLWQDRTPSTYDAKENFILALGFGGSVHSDLAPRQKLARWRAGRGRPPSLGWLGSNKTRIQPCGARACTPPSNRAQSTRCHLISG